MNWEQRMKLYEGGGSGRSWNCVPEGSGGPQSAAVCWCHVPADGEVLGEDPRVASAAAEVQSSVRGMWGANCVPAEGEVERSPGCWTQILEQSDRVWWEHAFLPCRWRLSKNLWLELSGINLSFGVALGDLATTLNLEFGRASA